jgi:hypothetical protein
MPISADVAVFSHGFIQNSRTSSVEYLSLLCSHKPAAQTDKPNSHSLTLIDHQLINHQQFAQQISLIHIWEITPACFGYYL